MEYRFVHRPNCDEPYVLEYCWREVPGRSMEPRNCKDWKPVFDGGFGSMDELICRVSHCVGLGEIDSDVLDWLMRIRSDKS